MLSPDGRRAPRCAGPLLVGALLTACWADFPDQTPRPGTDGASRRDGPARDGVVQPPRTDRGTTPRPDLRRADGPIVPQPDQRVPQPDQRIPRDRAAPPPADLGRDGAPPSSGLAQVCTGPGTCPGSEKCVFMDLGAAKGVCLRPCSQPNTPCSTPDPKFASTCMQYPSVTSGVVTVCVVLCRFEGQTYPCPSSAHYCKSLVPGVRVCAAQN